MIQEILPHVFENTYTPAEPQPEDIIFSFRNRQILARQDGLFFQRKDCPDNIAYTYLFRIDDRSFFLADLSAMPHILLPVNAMRRYQPRHFGFAAVTACQLDEWISANRYCGRCASPTVFSQNERALVCPECGNTIYPKISPAVIVGIISSDNRILTSRYAGSRFNHDALIAGYAEIGETIEETVHREVREETGLEVKDLVYYRSQPWPFSSSLLFGFWCRTEGSEEVHVDHRELKSAVWKSAEEVEKDTDHVSLTAEMIEQFRKGNHPYGS